ncbi:hypothetical protein KCP76_06055 [Salmonella enterica subsp. enterica serovar Weltevreden]|nr:hypothetical protein KCP76_06055 [Salmonella enterica subsp. enterica serovar Weltevreden]
MILIVLLPISFPAY